MSTVTLNPYLYFDGRTDEAIAFYKEALGAEVKMLMRFKESPIPHSGPPGSEDKVMHGNLSIGGATVLVSDGHCGGQAKFDGFGLTLNAPDDATAKRMFDALSEGGEVAMPFAETFFASSFGMVKDKFGVMWITLKERSMA